MSKLGFIFLVFLLLGGCGSRYSSNGENLYLQNRNGAIVEVPPPLTADNINHFYDLPIQNENAKVSIAPPV